MFKKAIACFLIAILTIPTFFACTQKKEKQIYENFNCFDTYSTLTIYGTKEEVAPFFEEFDKILNHYHKLLDIYNSYDDTVNLKTINDTATNKEITISKELFDVIEYGIEMHEKTDGKLNIALGAVTSIWHDIREKASNGEETITLPSQATIDEALPHTDIKNVLLDEKSLAIKFTDENLSLDLGGIAKGYVASLLYERLIFLGCKDFLINLGGNVVSSGTKPDQTLWAAAIENPFKTDSLGYNESVTLNHMTLVTSGSYQRYFIYDGKNYSHIIDPKTGFPPKLFASVTIQAPSDDSCLADALSTALFCMNFEDGLELISSIDNVEALWIFNDGSYKTSENFGGEK